MKTICPVCEGPRELGAHCPNGCTVLTQLPERKTPMKTYNVLCWFKDGFQPSMWLTPFWPPCPKFIDRMENFRFTYSDPCCSDPSAYDFVIADPRFLDPEATYDFPLFIVDPHDETFLRDSDVYGRVKSLKEKVIGIIKHTDSTNDYKTVIPFNGVIFSNYYQTILHVIQTHNRTYDERPIDVMFIGTVGSYWKQEIKEFRNAVIEKLRNLDQEIVVLSAGSYDDKVPKMRTNSYGMLPSGSNHALLMTLTKIAISPPGYSENSTRDLEAIDAGCHLLKPFPDDTHLPRLTSWPYTYRANNFCHLSNLARTIDDILQTKSYPNVGNVESVDAGINTYLLNQFAYHLNRRQNTIQKVTP